MIRTKTPLITAALAAGALAASAPAAVAHTEVASTSPARGRTGTTSVTVARVTFTGQIRSGTLKITGPGGRKATRGRGGRDPRNVKRLMTSFKSNLKAGRYKARWTIVAVDGHEQSGSYRFRLKR